jgi:hypothetical protein
MLKLCPLSPAGRGGGGFGGVGGDGGGGLGGGGDGGGGLGGGGDGGGGDGGGGDGGGGLGGGGEGGGGLGGGGDGSRMEYAMAPAKHGRCAPHCCRMARFTALLPVFKYVNTLPTHFDTGSYTTCSVTGTDAERFSSWLLFSCSDEVFSRDTRTVVPLVHHAFTLLGPYDAGHTEPTTMEEPEGT